MLYNLYDITKIDSMKNVYIRKTQINNYNNYYLYVDFGFVCFQGKCLHEKLNSINIVEEIENSKYNTYDNFKNIVLYALNNNFYIRNLEIQVCKLAAESSEFIEKLVKHNKEYREKQIEKAKAAAAAKQKEKEIRFENEIHKFNELIKNSELKLLNKEKLYNFDIKIPYIDSEGYICYKDTKLILYLFNINEINVPIKTKGWINNKLVSVSYDENINIYTYSYNINKSTVFFNYLEMLLKVLNKKHSTIKI